MAKTIGMIAGNGRFPLLAAKEASNQGYRVAACAIENEANPELENICDSLKWVKIGELKKLVKFFKSENVTEAFMAGKVEKVRLFQGNVSPDLEMVKVLFKTRDFKDDSLLLGIADYLSDEGIELMDSTAYVKDALPGPGVLGKKKPTKDQMENVRFGFKMAKSVAGLDLGQTVVVKKKAVMAVEVIEGTDLAIKRGGELGGGQVTVVKVAKPKQDMRFDVPTVGLGTLEALMDAEADVFAFEAGKTIFLDRAEFIQKADHFGLVLLGVEEEK